MADSDQEKPKIIVDDDWKAEARAEKEKLTEETESAPDAAEGGGTREIPAASFSVLVSSLVTQTFFALGAIEDPQSGKRYVDPNLAKHHIDMLAVLEEKTAGNLTEEEKKLLDRAVYECRMQYVQLSQQISQARPGSDPAAGGGPAIDA